jgi:glycosyltransferase involved in cell wall biosynthesis
VAEAVDEYQLPEDYAFSVCRIEPENNIHSMLEAFSKLADLPLVIVGNWNNSDYGRDMRQKYAGYKNLLLLDPIYSLGKLKTLRSHARLYVHGHSAGGTNPSLVEAMHFAKPILAFDCGYNRCTTEGKALYFADADSLQKLLRETQEFSIEQVGHDMLEIAQRRYTWDVVAKQYFDLIERA